MILKRSFLAASAALALALAAPAAFAADLTITAASVKKGANAQVLNGIAGETISAGQPLYQAAASGKYLKADANSATAEVRAPKCIALHAASLDQPIQCQNKGLITIGATVTVGQAYVLSATAGGVAPISDLTAGDYPSLLGFATTAAVVDLNIVSAGVAKP